MTLLQRTGRRVYRQFRARERALARDVEGGTARRRRAAREWRHELSAQDWRQAAQDEALSRRGEWLAAEAAKEALP